MSSAAMCSLPLGGGGSMDPAPSSNRGQVEALGAPPKGTEEQKIAIPPDPVIAGTGMAAGSGEATATEATAEAPPGAVKRGAAAGGRRRVPAKRKRATPSAAAETETGGLSSYEEFRDTISYFFTLFQKEFTAAIEASARTQWDQLSAGDTAVHEDGGNSPLVEMRLDPAFGRMLCTALIGSDGQTPMLRVPRTKEQLAFWRGRAASIPGAPSLQVACALSEAASHLETLKEALTWHVASGGAAPKGAPKAPLRVVILGASSRYEYVAHHGGEPVDWSEAGTLAAVLADVLAEAVEAVAPGRPAEFLLCGRDVPESLDGEEHEALCGQVKVRHRVGYLHDLPSAEAGVERLRGALFVAFHAGLGLQQHPELGVSWRSTVELVKEAAPSWLAMTSFNCVEHDLAEKTLRDAIPQLVVDRSGVNQRAGLQGLNEVGPFDGSQGKRNYCLLCARTMPAAPEGSEGLFD